MGNFKETLGINELKDKKGNIWKALVAEFLGNLLLNFFGCAPVVFFGLNTNNYVGVALAFGLTIFVVVQVRINNIEVQVVKLKKKIDVTTCFIFIKIQYVTYGVFIIDRTIF